VIANGRTHGVSGLLARGLGTLFPPRSGRRILEEALDRRAPGSPDACGERRSCHGAHERGASLLPAGVVEVIGSFGISDVVALVDRLAGPGRGIVAHGRGGARLAGHRTDGPGKKNSGRP
jgi:glutamate 5-kinase